MEFYENLETAMRHFIKTGAFLTVKSGEHVNTMTVSWGFIGFIWGKPHFVTVVRPQRYTNELLQAADSFTISIPFDTLKDELRICGTQSGRDLDKSGVVQFADAKDITGAVVSGCDMYYECKIACVDQMRGDVLPAEVLSKFYNNDLHQIYVGEIVRCYTK